MKTKEQLAEEWAEEKNKHSDDLHSASDFIAGYDAAKSEDAKIIAENDKLLADRIRVDAKHIEQLQASCAKKDEKIRELELDRQAFKNCQDQLNFSRHRIETLELAKEYHLQKIEELERAASGDNAIIAELNHKLEAANSLIDELEERLESARGWTITHAMQTYSRAASNETERIDEALEKIKQWKDSK